MRKFRIYSVFIILALLSACRGPLNSDLPAKGGADKFTLSYKDHFQSSPPSEIEGLEKKELVHSYPLLEEYAFLRLRPQQTILKGVRESSGKGESWKSEEYYLKTDEKLFQLGYHGTSEFVHFDWDVTIENATKLFHGIVGRESHGVYILSVKQYDDIRERIVRKYPEAIVSRRDLTLSPTKLIHEGDKDFVHCEAVVYIRDGEYYPEGKIENSLVRYSMNIGNGILESEIEVLIRGPYETDPLYWGGINGMAPPSDENERKAILGRFRKMNEFHAFVDKLLKDAGEPDSPTPAH